MTSWFTSDTHFGHSGILRYCPESRPFSSVEEMNEAIIERWNKRVRPHDSVYFLGDFSFEKDPAPTFARLNGRKTLCKGNHDHERRKVLSLPWEEVTDYKIVKENGVRAVLLHYPIESWWNQHHGWLHFHGHQHNSGRKIPHRFDVGFDAFPHGPMSFEELKALADAQTFEPNDHHGAD